MSTSFRNCLAIGQNGPKARSIARDVPASCEENPGKRHPDSPIRIQPGISSQALSHAGRLLTLTAFLLPTPLLAADAIAIRGSVTVKPVIEAAAKVYQNEHPGFAISIVGTGTAASYKAVTAGEVPVGLVVREPKPDEKAACPELTLSHIGRDPLVLVVNASNAVGAITTDQVRKLYTGEVADWSALGGSGPVTLVTSSEAMSTTEFFEQGFNLRHQADPADPKTYQFQAKDGTGGTGKASVGATIQAVLAQVAMTPAAIGYASLGLSQTMIAKGGKIRILTLDGVVPSGETANNGTYPIIRTLSVVTKGPPAGEIAGFITFLQGPVGQKVVADSGFVTIK